MKMEKRIEGYDFARAIAIFGMVFVNFKIVLGSTHGSEALYGMVSLLEGRASVLFVVLAGAGISLMSKVQNNNGFFSKKKVSLYKRGFLLILFGLLLAPIWPADILHFYGFYFFIAAFFINSSGKILWLLVVLVCIMFIFLLLALNYEVGWDFSTLTYLDFWTFKGMLRHIFFNGFHPVFPWVAFIFIGMWLGRKDLQKTSLRRNLIVLSGIIWAVVEVASKFLVLVALKSIAPDNEVLVFLDTAMMPPAPLYMIAASSLAVLIVCVSIEITKNFPQYKPVKWFVCTGRLALTLYIAHIFIGMGIMDSLGFIGNQSIEVAVFSAFLFSCFGMLFSVLWLRAFRIGPVELVFRTVAG